MRNWILVLCLMVSTSSLDAKDKDSLSGRMKKAVKEYVKDTDTYKMIDSGRKKVKKVKEKIEKKWDKFTR